ncbi:MAG: ParB/RepB/Spo0J family partition protein [Firmicutes bacterium]|nr:ParB/RepB/Spo0J family partition protein [Bacillota bacterium]
MALGKGLDALLGDTALLSQNGGSVSLPISQVEPGLNQPRKHFDEEALADLSESIRQHGILQPLTVRRLASGYYQIIAGERRWRAARMAGLSEVPAMIVEADDRKVMELGLIENLQREDLNPMEEAMGYQSLIKDYGLTQEEVSLRVSKSRPTVANAMRLLQLPQEVQWLIEQGSISAGHGRAMLPLANPEIEIAMAEEVMRKNLSVREVEERVRRMRNEDIPDGSIRKEPDQQAQSEAMYYRDVELRLTQDFGRKVTITPGRKHGKLTLEYYDLDDLNALLSTLNAALKPKKGGKQP